MNSSVVLEAGIYLSHIIWRIRNRKLLREAKAAGKSVDEMLELERKESEGRSESGDGVISTRPGDLESHGVLEQQEKEKVHEHEHEQSITDEKQ